MKKTTFKVLALTAFPVLFLIFQNFRTPIVTAPPEKFKIIWHLGSAIEPIADATGEKLNILNSLKSRVDGYYFLVLNNGSLLTYWKDRPIECLINYKSLKWKNEDGVIETKITLNGKRYGQRTKERCAADLELYQANLWNASGQKEPFKQFQKKLHEDALKRVLVNLNIKGEQAAGKKVMAEMLLRTGDTGDFIYNHKTDRIRMIERDNELSIPKSFDFLRDNGIFADRMMTYQEPRPQSENDSLLRVPLEPGGRTDYTPGRGGCEFCLPQNLRVIDMVADAFDRANVPAPRMAINIRTWGDDLVTAVRQQLKARPSKFDGINVEGNASKFEESSYERRIEGVKWMMENTNKPVSFLVPGTLQQDETDTEEMRDEKYLEHFLAYVNKVNSDLNVQLKIPKGKHAICNSRISFIVGSYGSPLHMQTLPIIRRDVNGDKTRKAGTVGSTILELSRLRDRLCK